MQMLKDILSAGKDLSPYNKILSLVTENIAVGDIEYTGLIQRCE